MSSVAYGIVQKARCFTGKVKKKIKIMNAKWDKTIVARGESAKLSADTKGIPDSSRVNLKILKSKGEEDGILIEEMSVVVQNNKLECEWKPDFNAICLRIKQMPYVTPKFFFKITYESDEGSAQTASDFLELRDWIKIELVDDDKKPVKGQKYVLHLPDGTQRDGILDDNGQATIEDIPIGEYTIDYPEAISKSKTKETKEDDLSTY
jgi:hypothetical protein